MTTATSPVVTDESMTAGVVDRYSACDIHAWLRRVPFEISGSLESVDLAVNGQVFIASTVLDWNTASNSEAWGQKWRRES